MDQEKIDAFADAILLKHKLKNDAALSVAMKVTPPAISKWRHVGSIVSPQQIINAHKLTGWCWGYNINHLLPWK